jgi:hypothetical protein
MIPLIPDVAAARLTDEYNLSSANDCVAGRMNCVRSVIREMERRFEPLGRSCDQRGVRVA